MYVYKQESKESGEENTKNVKSGLKSIEEFQYAAVAAADALRSDLDQLKTENATLQTRLIESIQEATEAQVELAAIKMEKVVCGCYSTLARVLFGSIIETKFFFWSIEIAR